MSTKKTTLLISIGAGLEYYDFIVYGLLATYLDKIFFPASDRLAAIIQTFAIFALGYLARPIGGVILGHYGDRFGRKKIFLVSLSLMAGATFAIGCLPSYQTWGLAAAVVLLLLRILQGFAFGADLPGTFTFLIEHVGKTQRSLHCGFALASVSFGACLGSLLIFFLTKTLTLEQMLAYGWRIPFWLGGLLALISLIIRQTLSETPVFLHYRQTQKIDSNKPIAELFNKKFILSILIGIGITLLGACLIIFNIALPAYLKQFYHYTTATIYLWISLGLAWSAVALIFLGWLADRIGQVRQLTITALVVMFGVIFLFKLLSFNAAWALAVFIFVYQLIVAALLCSFSPLLPQIFPTSVRFTGTAFCYNMAFMIAGFTPVLLFKLTALTQHVQSVCVFFALLAAVTLLAARAIKLKLI